MAEKIAEFWGMAAEEAGKWRFSIQVSEEGRVSSVVESIVSVTGLGGTMLYEILRFESGDEGMAFDLERGSMGVVLLGGGKGPSAGQRVYKTGRIASVRVGEGLLGRVVDALGNPLDGKPKPGGLVPYPIERDAPRFTMRDFVAEPLYTGVKAIDSMLPIGRGQRELIIGDPSSGKTSVALDAIISQKRSDVICIYAAIGQKKANVLRAIDAIERHGDLSRVIVVSAVASDPPGLQFIAPYSATAMAEYFLDRGKDVLVVYDDLTKHADAYRSLSLLLKRPPGRESYPGDIFFIHSRLLERSAKLDKRFGGGSITALPVVETQQGRITSYIPTNLISITDGQIYLDTSLFNRGLRPAIDVSKSVSRIGGRAQTEAMRKVSEKLRLDYSRFKEVEVFTKFGAHVEEETARLIRRGESLREVLKQEPFSPLTPAEEVLSFIIVDSGALDELEKAELDRAYAGLLEKALGEFPDVVERIETEGMVLSDDVERVKKFARGEGG